jgi:hypothetical protein
VRITVLATVSPKVCSVRRKLRDRNRGYRRDYLCALTRRVEVILKMEARIIGSQIELLRTLTVNSGVKSAAIGVLDF